jgi:hypothetical protein
MSWNECMKESVPTRFAEFRERPLTPKEWCTACRPSWHVNGWFCYECGLSKGFFHVRLPLSAPLDYKHFEVRRVFRFLETPGYSDIFVLNSWNGEWEYQDLLTKLRLYISPNGRLVRWSLSRDGRRLVTRFEQDIRARCWLTEMYTLLTRQLHPFPDGVINAPGPGASKHLLSWLLYLRPFLLARPFIPSGAPPFSDLFFSLL